MQTDGWTVRRTDMTKLIVAFRNFVNAPKNVTKLQIVLTLSLHTPHLNTFIDFYENFV